MAVLAISIVALLWPGTTDVAAEQPWDGDLCPIPPDEPAGSATYLLDLRKPVGDVSAPGRALRDVLAELGKNEELRVYALTGDPAAPRQRIERLCKPYAQADLAVQGAKSLGRRDCDDLPAQISERVYAGAQRFCERRTALEARLEVLASARRRAVSDGYLIEAFEQTARAMARRPQPRRLYVYSDMVQHAPWYSHLDIAWPSWSYEAFASLRGGEAPSDGATAGASLAHVVVFQLLRARLTEPLRPRYAHQTFWRDYFRETRGAEVTFRELPATPGYAATRLMPRRSADVEQALREAQQTLAKSRQQQGAASLDAGPSPQPRPEAASAMTPQRPAPPPAVAIAPSTPPPSRRLQSAEQIEPAAKRPEVSAGAPEPLRPEPALAAAPPTSPPAPAPPAAPPEPNLAAPAELPTCGVSLLPEFRPALAVGGYPGNRRVDYGAAVVMVRYGLDERGRPIEVIPSVDAPTRLSDADRLAADTAAQVQSWRFAVRDVEAGACVPPARQIATFTYRRKCVGAPVPKCRTVRESVQVR